MKPQYQKLTHPSSIASRGGMKSEPVHDTLYTVFLGVLAFIQLLGTVTMGVMSRHASQFDGPSWTLQMVFGVELCILLFEAAVLVVRIGFPAHRKWPTLALNIFLLICIPFGTALAIYGLLKADKARRVEQLS